MSTRPLPTLKFIQEARRTHPYTLYDLLHGYIYARWPYLYIGIGTGEHPLARAYKTIIHLFRFLLPPGKKSNQGKGSLADGYHGKVVPLEAATQLVTIQEEIELKNLEQVIPFNRARDIILKNPDHIVVIECPCRASRPNPCRPLDVCLVIGEPFASMVITYHPQRARWLTPEEAIEILHAEENRGHVHHAFFKDAMLNRFYAICNCCSCCCGAMHAQRNGTPMLISSGFVSSINEEMCNSCALCTETCPFGAISLKGKGGCAQVDTTTCMGCGI
ncbi:MAG: 4Fe-4S binding protein, partial [Chloroflexota bacterium]